MQEEEEEYGIVCCFRLQDERTKKYWMNWLASIRTASPCIHSEFFFINDAVTVTVDSRRPVTFIEYGNDYRDEKKWESYVIWVSPDAYNAVYQFCAKEKGKPFDHKGIYCFDFKSCCTSPRDKGSWVCSRLMAEALIAGGILEPNIDPIRVTPTRLRELIFDASHRFGLNIKRYHFSTQ